MSVSTQGQVPKHNTGCEEAVYPDCSCQCKGMLHRRDLLKEALHPLGTPNDFNRQLTRTLGSRFTTLSGAPSATQTVRPGREKWQPRASTRKERSQVEQRLVDVGLRELLWAVRQLPSSVKKGWLPLADDFMAASCWPTLSTRIVAASGPQNKNSGFFWASCLAGAAATTAPRTPTAMSTTITGSARFSQRRYPRASSGRGIKIIKEARNSGAVNVAAGQISTALARSTLTPGATGTVLAVVGASVSPDLWQHPVAVRHLLLPALGDLRVAYGATYSLDAPTGTTEDRIDQYLGSRWAARRSW